MKPLSTATVDGAAASHPMEQLCYHRECRLHGITRGECKTESMSTENLNEAVWRALGWSECPSGDYWKHPKYGGTWAVADIRKYATDLNACAELRAMLSREQQTAYARNLIEQLDIVGEAEHGDVCITVAAVLCDATAEQHCRAWLAAKGVQP